MAKEFEREQKIVDAVEDMQFVEGLKTIATGEQTVLGHSPTNAEYKTAGEYIMYLENQIKGFGAGVQNPAGGNFKEAVDQDIQIVFKQPAANNMLQEAKIMTLNGRVKVQGGVKGYIQAVLEEAPEDMKFTLIEEKVRTKQKVVSAVASAGNVKIMFDDGTFQNVHLTAPPKEEFKFEDDEVDDQEWQ